MIDVTLTAIIGSTIYDWKKKEINNFDTIKTCGFCLCVAIVLNLVWWFIKAGLNNRKKRKINPMDTK